MATIPVGSRVDLWSTFLVIPDFGITVPVQSNTGGAADSEEARTRPGGGLPEVPLGGRTVMENVTVTVSLAHGGATVGQWRRLRSLVGRASAHVTQIPLDANRVAFGAEQIIYQGVLKRVGAVEGDANGSDGATFEVEITVTADSAGGGA